MDTKIIIIIALVVLCICSSISVFMMSGSSEEPTPEPTSEPTSDNKKEEKTKQDSKTDVVTPPPVTPALAAFTVGTSGNTGFNDEGGGNTIFLDRHNVDCGDNSGLSQFNLTRDGQGRFRYNFKCLKSKTPFGSCRDVNTGENDVGGGNSVFLDRHDVSCNDDEVIKQFNLVRPKENTIQYNYKCCKY